FSPITLLPTGRHRADPLIGPVAPDNSFHPQFDRVFRAFLLPPPSIPFETDRQRRLDLKVPHFNQSVSPRSLALGDIVGANHHHRGVDDDANDQLSASPPRRHSP